MAILEAESRRRSESRRGLALESQEYWTDHGIEKVVISGEAAAAGNLVIQASRVAYGGQLRWC